MIRTDTTACSSFVHLVAEIFGRDEVGIRLWSGALLLLLDLVLVAALSCLILFCWSPCCRLAPTSWQPCSSSWSTPGALLSDHGGWSVLLEYLSWCLGVVLGVLEMRWEEWCWDGWVCGVVRLPLWCLSTSSAKLYFALLTFWSKSWLCMLILDGELFWYRHL
jgi:hypothetical protein